LEKGGKFYLQDEDNREFKMVFVGKALPAKLKHTCGCCVIPPPPK
jgi:hypothetical protein